MSSSHVRTLPTGRRTVAVWSTATASPGTWQFRYAVFDSAAPATAGTNRVPAGAQLEPALLAAIDQGEAADLTTATVLTGTVGVDWASPETRRALNSAGPPLSCENGALTVGALSVLIAHLVFATDVVALVPRVEGLVWIGEAREHLANFSRMLSSVRGWAEIVEVEKHRSTVSKAAATESGSKTPRMPFDLRPFIEAEKHLPVAPSEGEPARYMSPDVRFAVYPGSYIDEHGDRGSDVGRKQILLFSGGLDSTLASLSDDLSDALLFHLEANANSRAAEREAVVRIAEAIGAADRLVLARLIFPDLAPLARRYSRIFGRHPYFNSIPHGRDLLLMTLASCLARHCGAVQLRAGYDAESKVKMVGGVPNGSFNRWWPATGPIPRHDFEHENWHEQLMQYVSLPGVALSGTNYLNSLAEVRDCLRADHPALYHLTNSCFWGRRCERCIKCIADHALTMRAVWRGEATHESLGRLGFASDPLDDPNAQELIDIVEGTSREVLAEGRLDVGQAAYGTVLAAALTDLRRLVDRDKYFPYWLRRLDQRIADAVGGFDEVDEVVGDAPNGC